MHRLDKHEDDTAFDTEEQTYNVKLFQIKPTQQLSQHCYPHTGTRVSICGTTQAKIWDLIDPMVPTQTKIKSTALLSKFKI